LRYFHPGMLQLLSPRRHIIKLSEILQPCVFSQIGQGLRLLDAIAFPFNVVSEVLISHPLESLRGADYCNLYKSVVHSVDCVI
jgi:hypothetical protein